jgi:hypothetical protein
MTFVADAEQAQERMRDYGVTGFMLASEHAWMRSGAMAAADGVHRLGD